MSATKYYDQISGVLAKIHSTQQSHFEKAAEVMASAIAAGKRVYLYGSGHSVIPVMDIFPRYGSFVGFFPLYDPRLMWSNVVGPGGARELLWLERKEGYAEVFLQSYALEAGDVIIVFSHGGLNAAPYRRSALCQEEGAYGYHGVFPRQCQSCKSDAFNRQDTLRCSRYRHRQLRGAGRFQVDIGRPEKVAAGSTMAVVFVAMSLVAETGARLVAKGHNPITFVSPNVPGIEKDHNQKVFQTFSRALFSRDGE